MVTEPQPTAEDIRALVSFLPKLYDRRDMQPIRQWLTNEEVEGGRLTLPRPKYDDTVENFIDLIVNQGCWLDCDYVPEDVERLLMDETAVRTATIPEIRRMLTVVVRGERFCDGWWSFMIEQRHVRRLLERLEAIDRTGFAENPKMQCP